VKLGVGDVEFEIGRKVAEGAANVVESMVVEGPKRKELVGWTLSSDDRTDVVLSDNGEVVVSTAGGNEPRLDRSSWTLVGIGSSEEDGFGNNTTELEIVSSTLIEAREEDAIVDNVSALAVFAVGSIVDIKVWLWILVRDDWVTAAESEDDTSTLTKCEVGVELETIVLSEACGMTVLEDSTLE
jgi:hypothetical protein